MLEKLFQLKAHNTSLRTEVLAGLTTFLTMAYILFVNPAILGETGMDKGAVFVATCLAAAIGSALMGLIANYPIALAPGMGLNAFFTYTVVLTMGYTWQVALGAVFISAMLFFLLSIFRIREWIINSIPLPLRSAITAGIGLFLALIALKEAGLVVDNPATLVGLGDLTAAGPLLAILGFVLIVALDARRVTGAVMIGILLVTALAIALGVTPFGGILSMPPSIAPTFLQLADLRRPFALQGQSLVELLANPDENRRGDEELIEYEPQAGNRAPGQPEPSCQARGIVTKNYKYVDYMDGSFVFYDLKRDPDEMQNLKPLMERPPPNSYQRNYNPVLNVLRDRLNLWRKQTRDPTLK